MSVRAVGVEQERPLVDPATGLTSAVSGRVVEQCDGAGRPRGGEAGTGVDVEQEFFVDQIETGRQRAMLDTTGDLRAVVRDLAESTLYSPVGAA